MARVTVTSGADATLAGGKHVNQSVVLKNKTGTASVYLEISGAAVNTSTSFEWEATDGPMSLDVKPGWTLLARSAGADQIVHVLDSPD